MSEILKRHGLEECFTKRDEPIVISRVDIQNARISIGVAVAKTESMLRESEILSRDSYLD